MGLTVVTRGRELRLAVFGHGPGEPVAALDWWARTCLVFTEYGAWTVRSAHGGGTASAAVMVAGSGGSEYACGHPHGVDDRNLCLIYPEAVAAPATTLVPVSGRIAALRRDLRRHLLETRADTLDGASTRRTRSTDRRTRSTRSGGRCWPRPARQTLPRCQAPATGGWPGCCGTCSTASTTIPAWMRSPRGRHSG